MWRCIETFVEALYTASCQSHAVPVKLLQVKRRVHHSKLREVDLFGSSSEETRVLVAQGQEDGVRAYLGAHFSALAGHRCARTSLGM